MNIIDAVQARHSVRDFLPTPVPPEVVMQILEVAAHSPSGGNSQPWEIFVAAGATLEAIRSAYLDRAAHPPPPVPAAPPERPGPPAYIRERMAAIRRERLALLGLDPDSPASARVLTEFGARLYGAPVLVVICMDKALSSNFDLGMLTQTICLTAQDFGLDSMIAAALVAHRDVLRQALEIPEQLEIVIGVGLGYANPDHIINTYRSPRRPIAEVVRYKG